MDYTQLWQHYNDIKVKYNLTYTDIFRQMGVYPNSCYIRYLSSNRQTPSSRTGTIGRGFRDLLLTHINKIDWSPSTATYSDKLNEMMSTNQQHITASMANTCSNCIQCQECSKRPVINVNINVSEVSDNYVEEQLERMFTIDGIVPKIQTVSKSMYC